MVHDAISNIKTFTDRQGRSQRIDRYIAGAAKLSMIEFAVLRFIHDKTTEWGKPAAPIKARWIVEGDPDGGQYEDKARHSGFGISLRSASEAIRGLRKKGIITELRRKANGVVYLINYDWKQGEDMLREPKKGRKRSANPAYQVGKICLPIGEDNNREEKTKGTRRRCAGVDEGKDLQTIVREAKDKNEQRRRIKLDKARVRAEQSGKVDLIGAEAAWTEGLQAGFPRAGIIPAWTKRERGQVMHIWGKVNTSRETFLNLLRWITEEWRTIMETVFSWMNKKPKPERPNVGFVLVWVSEFVRAYEVREELKARPVDAKERFVQHAVDGGLREEEAEEAFDAELALIRARKRTRSGQALKRVSNSDQNLPLRDRFLRGPKP